MEQPKTVFVVEYRSQLRAFPNRDAAMGHLRKGGVHLIDRSTVVDQHSHPRLYEKLWVVWVRAHCQDYVYMSPELSQEELFRNG